MKKFRYTNSFVQNTPIVFGLGKTQYGNLLSEYQVKEYCDLRTSAQGGTPMRAYIVDLKQRLVMSNSNADSFGGLAPYDSYIGYPILAVQKVIPSTTAANVNFYLEDYTPKTLNASVNTSQNQGTSSSTSSATQHMVGSSTSVTNTYEVSASIGFFGELPTGSAGGSYSNSTTNTQETSQSDSQGKDRGVQASTGSSMSVKDWASYSFLDSKMQAPSWVWGQEYPWNVINFRGSPDQGSTITLPPYVVSTLYDGDYLYPPSHLSQFGFNFVAHAKWIFYVSDSPGIDDEQVSFNHNLTYWTGEHSQEKGACTASVNILASDLSIETVQLNLPVIALDPIPAAGAGNGAVVGFVKSEFINMPDKSNPFRLKSGENNLYITQGLGFDSLVDDDSVLSASNITNSQPASFTLQFKVNDPSLELTLYLRHWKTKDTACLMNLTINNQNITRYIDMENAGSGTDNVTEITLRNLNYTSPDFYDYLIVGLNTITIKITPADGVSSCGYALRALAIQ